MFSKKLNKAALAAVVAPARGGARGPVAAAHADPVGTMKAAPEWVDGDFKFKMRGRLMYDIGSVSTDYDIGTDTSFSRSSVRRARIGVEGQFNKLFKYKAELTAGNNNSNNWEDLYVEYAGSGASIIVGNSNVLEPLEEKTSSRFITFNERAAVMSAFGYGRTAGISPPPSA